MKVLYYLFFLFLSFNPITSVSFNMTKQNSNANPPYRKLIEGNLIKTKSGLYTISLSFGVHKQSFNLIFDTGSCITWVGDENCDNCPSKNLYSPYLSNFFTKTEQELQIGYTSGLLHGYICHDILYVDGRINIQKFSFLLADYAMIAVNAQIDGIAGFMRKFTDDNVYFSLVYRMYEDKIIAHRYFIVDITTHNPKGQQFYIGETPTHILHRKSVICFNIEDAKNEKNKYWKCPAEFFSFEDDDIAYPITSTIMLDSGTNGIIAPKELHSVFKKKVFIQLIHDSICEEAKLPGQIYQIKCFQDITNLAGLKLPDLLITINGKIIRIDMMKIYNIETNEFNLYFCNSLKGWVFGVPFFEQYATLFDYDNNIVKIYLNEDEESNSFFSLRQIIWFLILFIISILVGGRAYLKKKLRCQYRAREEIDKEINLVSTTL